MLFPPGESRPKSAVRLLVAFAMTAIGITHFVNPEGFVKIVPAWLPAPLVLVWVSGVFEVLGGVGLLIARVRVFAAWGLVALFVAVFPANINMAIHHIQIGEHELPVWAMWARLPFQALFVAVAVWLARVKRSRASV
jgi:uncharacterized membrane protein